MSAKIVRRSRSLEARDPREREVVGGDLRALVEAAVVEERHAGRELLGQALGRAAGVGDELERVAVAEPGAERPQRLGVERHQLVFGLLAERVRQLVGASWRAARRSTTGRCRGSGRRAPRPR